MIEDKPMTSGDKTPPETGTDDKDRQAARERIWNSTAEGLELDELPYAERGQ